jgi:hypothetical protein
MAKGDHHTPSQHGQANLWTYPPSGPAYPSAAPRSKATSTQDLKSSGFPRCFKGKQHGNIDPILCMATSIPSFDFTYGDIEELVIFI